MLLHGAVRGIAAIGLVITSACSKPTTPPAPATAAAPASTTTASGSTAPAATGAIIGRGPAPSSSGAVVVVLEPRGPREFPAQSEKPVMDQVGLTFDPELLFVRTGQPVEFRNNDDTLHNVNVKHEETREQAFNVAIPTGGTYEHTFPRDGFYRVGCDIHPAMAASIFAASTPFTALAEPDGTFRFSDVPRGPWKVVVYAAGRRLQRDVDVQGAVTEVAVE
jgi:plastocyanin